MAKAPSKLKSTAGKEPASITERFYTIGYVPSGFCYPNPRPQVTIKGRWLEQFGFYVGCPVIIKVEHNKLIIKLAIKF